MMSFRICHRTDLIGKRQSLSKIPIFERALESFDVLLIKWGKVTVTWWAHKIKGLHRNDFIMAGKTDQRYRAWVKEIVK